MEKSQSEQVFEVKNLEHTIAIAEEQLAVIRRENEESKAAIMAAKKELREDTSHAIANLWSKDSFSDLVNFSQYANQVSDKLSEYDQQARKIQALEKLIDSPYFARIDFKFDGVADFEKFYIGRSSLHEEQSYEMAVYDWRSPISSVFYRFTLGEAFYDSPGGRITGQVNLKRQYEIKRGQLEYYFDADVQIIDEFLRKLLSQNASSQMKTIVETIQKEQDMIIRDMEVDLMMVQGAAGSGKTSVALHRAAYLMYQGLTEKLTHNNIVVISPNRLFERYIANVLPELGENQVNSLLFDDILSNLLQREDIQTKNQFLEYVLTSDRQAEGTIAKEAMKFKGSSQFVEILNRFTADLPMRWLQFTDIYYDGRVLVSWQLLKSQLLQSNPEVLLSLRLRRLEKSILKSVHKERKERMEKLRNIIAQKPEHEFEVEEVARMLSIQESTVLIKSIRKFTELDCFELYRKLFSDKNYFYSLAKGLELPDCIEDILNLTRKNLQKKELQHDDALALTFLQLKTKGNADSKAIKQVVIDETQDYYPIHFEILKELFPKARYTVLGDIHQTIGKQESMDLYARVAQILDKEKSTLVTLAKSFRCTQDILEYSAQFLSPGSTLNSFSRKGDVPEVFTAPNQAAFDQLILNEVNTCQEKNYQSIGIICKAEKDAIAIYERLKDKIPLQLINSDTVVDLIGVLIIPVYLSKGLEFDGVLICDVDAEHYHSDDDRNLLYIACTRALHRLNLFYTGDISPLLSAE
ncbi:DNA/RNA helicase, superfamily I [Desulfitobacterium dichloroeliminans LMG P-21439]|uniref:DNA/RNA helicase, superfamily I n=1 Tax=Desulfitobacterium dichloroeliminans (strain LMG P-21439 / DCA1) TaxID=871963 RepID=L0F527_DESDL|nr:ATP-binding domain-containing protein [Desulfitobacterium dichloroeliminans]AGA68018.1 DNA/RNA helicase, superfamily I [Desulfitobacterium dichloroeliminans LMG P-21439]